MIERYRPGEEVRGAAAYIRDAARRASTATALAPCGGAVLLATNRFARAVGLMREDVGYEQVVAMQFRDAWVS